MRRSFYFIKMSRNNVFSVVLFLLHKNAQKEYFFFGALFTLQKCLERIYFLWCSGMKKYTYVQKKQRTDLIYFFQKIVCYSSQCGTEKAFKGTVQSREMDPAEIRFIRYVAGFKGYRRMGDGHIFLKASTHRYLIETLRPFQPDPSRWTVPLNVKLQSKIQTFVRK